jgi:hypothetical protein
MLAKSEGQSRMDIPETLATLGTQDTTRRQTKPKTTNKEDQKMNNTDPTQTRRQPRCFLY